MGAIAHVLETAPQPEPRYRRRTLRGRIEKVCDRVVPTPSNSNPTSRLEQMLGRLSALGASAGLALFSIVAACAVHTILTLLERRPMILFPFLNVVLEAAIVSLPLILYSRRVIAALNRSRSELKAMSRRLAIAVDHAEHTSRAKSAFLANMSHELRTPLNAILGFSEVMKDQHLGPVHNARYLSYAADIHASGRHLLGIINDVLDLSKIEAGKMSLDSAAEFTLRTSVAAALGMLAGLGEKYGVRITADLPDETIRLVAVERMIQQILINLIGNAVKFTPSGGTVHIAGVPQSDGGYQLTVRDTGIGMTDAEIANALVPFGQNSNRQTVKHDGTGLGLPLAKAMMELHGGILAIVSEPNRGTTIALQFPATRLALRQQAAA